MANNVPPLSTLRLCLLMMASPNLLLLLKEVKVEKEGRDITVDISVYGAAERARVSISPLLHISSPTLPSFAGPKKRLPPSPTPAVAAAGLLSRRPALPVGVLRKGVIAFAGARTTLPLLFGARQAASPAPLRESPPAPPFSLPLLAFAIGAAAVGRVRPAHMQSATLPLRTDGVWCVPRAVLIAFAAYVISPFVCLANTFAPVALGRVLSTISYVALPLPSQLEEDRRDAKKSKIAALVLAVVVAAMGTGVQLCADRLRR
ncbi:MAG: hypothetical protein SGPRY_006114 [Prymnesium sp.]